jgi:hypothetical protein
MKGKSCIPENLFKPIAGFAETEQMMRTGMPADSIRARGPLTAPQRDAGYMTATSPSAKQRIPLAPRGGPYMARRRIGCACIGPSLAPGPAAPAPLRTHARAYACRGLPASCFALPWRAANDAGFHFSDANGTQAAKDRFTKRSRHGDLRATDTRILSRQGENADAAAAIGKLRSELCAKPFGVER